MIRDIATIKLIEKLESENAILREALERIAEVRLEPAYCYEQSQFMSRVANKALQVGGGE